TSPRTNLKLQHGPRGTNNDQVTLGKDAHGIWLITDINVARPARVTHQAATHHLTLSARQAFSRAAMVFAANGGDMGAGLAVTAGTRVVLFATGTMNITPSKQQVKVSGTSCSSKALPESSLNCYAIVYSSGSVDQ